MGPHIESKAEREERISAIIDFASRLLNRLDSHRLDSTTLPELSQHVAKSFPIPPLSKVQDLDKLGRGLWNASIQSQQRDVDYPGFSTQLRTFAFFLLDIAYQAFTKKGRHTNDNLIRVLRVALKTGRVCINEGQIDLATRVFGKAAAYVETRNKEHGPRVNPEEEDEQIIKQLTAEYFLLRATLAWKSERLDLVNHWLSTMITYSEHDGGIAMIEKRADFLFEVGKAALKKKDYSAAVEWLSRSFDTIEVVDGSAFTPDFDELRLAVISELVRALIGSEDSVSLSRAFELIARMRHELPEFRMSTSLLRLDCLFAQKTVDAEQVFNEILRIIDSVHMIDNNITMIIHQIHQLKKANADEKKNQDSHSVRYACQAIDRLLPRLYEFGNQSWIEKAVVTRIWLGVAEQPTLAAASRLGELFEETFGTTGKPFSQEATHAAQSLLWKLIDTPIGPPHDGAPEVWCRLACHALFQRAGDLNKSKLNRKMMLSALAAGNTGTAREAYYAMPESGKNAPVTNYIMYKLALRSGDIELASTSLEKVLKGTSSDSTFLYACTLEAQQSGDRTQAIAAMQKVMDYYNHSTPQGLYLPALLRATAKMIIVELKTDAMPKATALLEICKIFEAAMSQAKGFRTLESGESNKRYQAELHWFASNSYNLAVSHMVEVHPELLVRFMTVCMAFVDMLRVEDPNDDGLVYRLLLCRFLAASALVVLGRTEDNVERSLSHYLDGRRQIEAFQRCHADANERGILQANTRENLDVKGFELLKYDLEALLKLQHWHDLDRVLGLCLAQQHSDRWGTIADLVIHIHMHISMEGLDHHYQTKIPLVIEKIVNTSWKQNGKDVKNFSRWMRCLYQMTLNMNPTMALQCVKTARVIALGARADHAPKYPKEELSWLATSAFNHAIDTYCAGDRDSGQRWAENALNLAMVTGKDTSLHDTLQANWMGLQARAAK